MKSLAVNAIALLASLAYLFFVAGFWFHHSYPPRLFGRYSVSCFFGLCLATTAVVAVFFGVRRLFTTGVIVMPSGRRVSVSVSTKLLVLLLASLVLLWESERVLDAKFRATTLAGRAETLKKFHPFLQVAPVAGDTRLGVNRWGFRGEDIEKAKPAGTFRVFEAGGSTVFCQTVDFEHSHPRILERLLRERYPAARIEVQNAGMHWYTSQHSLFRYLSQVRDFHPDLVILYQSINDLYRGFSPPAFADGPYRPDYGHFSGPVARMIRQYRTGTDSGLQLTAYLQDLLAKTWYTDFARPPNRPQAVEWTDWASLPSYTRNMRALVRAIRADGARVVMASEPYLYKETMTPAESGVIVFPSTFCVADDRCPNINSMIHGMEAFNKAARQIAQDEGIPFVELEAAIPKTLDHFIDDVHYTEKGNAIVAETFANEVEREELIH